MGVVAYYRVNFTFRERCVTCGEKINSDSASLRTEIRGQYWTVLTRDNMHWTGVKQTVMM
jgi:hypothetical protein